MLERRRVWAGVHRGSLVMTVLAVCAVPGGAAAQIRFSPVYRVGAFDDPPEQVFGEHVTPVLSPSGELFVGDWSTGQIRHFDARGRFVREFGRKGRGPGEFLEITSMELGPSGDSLYVYDGVNHRMTVLTRTGRVARTIAPPLDKTGMMRMSLHPAGFLLFTGQVEGRPELVHVLDMRGRYVRSFAPLLNASDLAGVRAAQPMVRSQLNQGYARALPDGDVLVLLSAPYRVGRFSLTGARRWSLADGVIGNPVAGNFIVATPTEYRVGLYPSTTALHAMGDDHFLVMYGDYERERRFYDVRSARDGRLLLRRSFPFDSHMVAMLPLRSGGMALLSDHKEEFVRLSVSRWELH